MSGRARRLVATPTACLVALLCHPGLAGAGGGGSGPGQPSEGVTWFPAAVAVALGLLILALAVPSALARRPRLRTADVAGEEGEGGPMTVDADGPLAQTDALVRARLGRRPQDALEAAVVLEAWGGVQATSALALGQELMTLERGQDVHAPGEDEEEEPVEAGLLGEALSLVLAVVAVAAWTPSLARQLGTPTVEVALWLALPLTLALQWALRSRYLGRIDGLGRLSRQRTLLATLVLALVAVPSLVLGTAGALGGLLVATWVGGSVLGRRGWGLGYAALLAAVALGLAAGVPAFGLVGAAAALTLAAVSLALPPRVSSSHDPGPLRPAVLAALIGAGLGALLVGDSSVGWGTHGALTAVALIPSTLASFWSGHYLWRLRKVVPRALANVSVFETHRRSFGGPTMQVLTGALLRLLGGTLVLSLVLALATRSVGVATASFGLLVGFGCIALVTLVVSLLESLGHAHVAVVAVAVALAGELGVGLSGSAPAAGAGLIVGGALGALVALPPTIRLLVLPGRALATSFWIS